jgi:hypothetical protein
MILGLNGLKGSGKDTVAAYLIKEYGFERRAFADPLKKSVATLFDIPFHKIDEYKNDPKIWVELSQADKPILPIGAETFKALTFREFLQRYGTESHRGVFGENFWVDQTMPKDAFYSGRKIVITDLRFDNEAKRVHDCGGSVIRIDRPEVDTHDTHVSEAPLAHKLVDFILQNDKGLDELYALTESMLTYIGGARAAEIFGGEVQQ